MSTADSLYDAIEAGDTTTVAQLVGQEPDLVEGAGMTPPPLHWAIFHNRLSMVEALVENGADIERRDQDRHATPLAYAIVYGRTDVVRQLIRLGADVNGMCSLAERGAAGEFDQYPDVASAKQFADMLKALNSSHLGDLGKAGEQA